MTSKAQIIATIGPASYNMETILTMANAGMDVARLNFSWQSQNDHAGKIDMLRKASAQTGKTIPIIQDLPGPRIQKGEKHTYDSTAVSILTDSDKEFIRFGTENNLEYVAMSFVSKPEDIELCRKTIIELGGHQKVIAKIERAAALENIDQIIEVSDAIMIARGDLGNEVPLEKIPFVQADIIRKAKKLGKPVITATEMMKSMVDSPVPTRADVTDVANAILLGSDCVMLSEETAVGKYPVQVIAMMEKIISEAEKHIGGSAIFNVL